MVIGSEDEYDSDWDLPIAFMAGKELDQGASSSHGSEPETAAPRYEAPPPPASMAQGAMPQAPGGQEPLPQTSGPQASMPQASEPQGTMPQSTVPPGTMFWLHVGGR